MIRTSLHGEPAPCEAGNAHTTVADPLDALVRSYRAALVRFFAKRLANSADAEDLAHEVFIRIARHGDPADITHIEGYLFQTASNLLRDRARRDATHRAGQHISLDEAGYEGEAPSEERVYEARQALEGLVAVLAQMPPRRRMVFVMHRFMGSSYGTIAAELGISVGVVEKHMMKALLQIHCALEPL
jgi:RNA polymerase sigma-70 factor (ECF subfamily)